MDQVVTKNNKILLLDSEKNVLYTYRAVLEDEHYNVTVASSLEEVNEILSQSSFDILVTELYLNGLNTLELVRTIKKTLPDIYIIMLTSASFTPKIYEEVISSGVQDFFTKPFPISNLLVNIKKGLRTRSLSIEKKGIESKLFNIEKLHQVLRDNDFFLRALGQELARAKRYGKKFSILLVDNNYLRDIAKLGEFEFETILVSKIRGSDTMAKLNGNYGFILPETLRENIHHFTNRLTKEIQPHMVQTKYINENKTINNMITFQASYPEESTKIIEWTSNVEKNIKK